MGQNIEASTSQFPREVFGFAFKEWLFIFITVLVPLDFLYRISQLLSGLSSLQIVSFLSSLVVFLASFALIIASVSFIVAYLCSIININSSRFIIKANALFGLIAIIVIFVRYLSKWTDKVFNVSIDSLNIYLYYLIIIALLISIICYIYYKGQDLSETMKDMAGAIFKVNASISVFCAICLLVFTLIFSFSNQDDIQFIASTKNNQPKSYPNIILITFDALAANHMSLYGFHDKTTPNMDKLGQQSYVFDNMYSGCNWTLPSLASIMSGKYPDHHGITNALSYFWGYNRSQNMAFLLKKLGYETAVVWSSPYACPWDNNLKGFDHIVPKDSINKLFCETGNPWLAEIGNWYSHSKQN